MIYLKSPAELLAMREAGRIVAQTLDAVRSAIKPGVSTWELNRIAAEHYRRVGAIPAFVGYPPNSRHPFPSEITVSINSEILHGIPSKTKVLQDGDIITIDTACQYQGFTGDSAFTTGVGAISSEAQRLLDVTEQALHEGIRVSQAGRETRDVAEAVQEVAKRNGYSVLREYTGHGIGQEMHEEPDIPNWWPTKRERRLRRKFRSHTLKPGMTYTIEPMFSLGAPDVEVLDDHWTVVMRDGALSAHFEHTIAIVENEPLILTLL